MIATGGELVREINRIGDDFIVVKLEDKEYVIDHVCKLKVHTDPEITRLCLVIRDGGEGNIKR